jgi:hypothetical protein
LSDKFSFFSFNYLTLFFNFAQIIILESIKGKAMQRVSNLEKEDYTTSEKEIFEAAEQFFGQDIKPYENSNYTYARDCPLVVRISCIYSSRWSWLQL